jgi:endonuclease/exonuclease/phosphatase family metal-dependent hydrolase
MPVEALPAAPASQLNQARVLVGTEWLDNPECRSPVILCGDFNTQFGSTVFKLLEERLRYVEALKVNGQNEKTWPSSHPVLSFDHMFISGGLAVDEVKVPADGVVRTASDHLPLFVQISLPDITGRG